MAEPTQEQLDWRGEFSLDDCETKYFTPDLPYPQRAGFVNAGVELIHKPSGMTVFSQGSMDQSVNESRAIAAMKDRLKNRR